MLRKLILAGAIVAVSGGLAFAQSSPSTANTTGPDVKPTQDQPTDMGAGNETGTTKAQPGGKMGRGGRGSSGMTTGSGGNSPTGTYRKNSSPTSGAEGTDKEK